MYTLWYEKQFSIGGPTKFFIISLSHASLGIHYKTNFDLMQHHKYSLAEIDNLIPWEKEIYIGMLIDLLQEQKRETERQN